MERGGEEERDEGEKGYWEKKKKPSQPLSHLLSGMAGNFHC
jgi:hypothetical protein